MAYGISKRCGRLDTEKLVFFFFWIDELAGPSFDNRIVGHVTGHDLSLEYMLELYRQERAEEARKAQPERAVLSLPSRLFSSIWKTLSVPKDRYMVLCKQGAGIGT